MAVFQYLSVIDDKLKGLLRRNPHISLSRLFRLCRRDKRISVIADYPKLSYLIRFSKEKGRKFTRKQIRYALNKSKELSKLLRPLKQQVLNNLDRLTNDEN